MSSGPLSSLSVGGKTPISTEDGSSSAGSSAERTVLAIVIRVFSGFHPYAALVVDKHNNTYYLDRNFEFDGDRYPHRLKTAHMVHIVPPPTKATKKTPVLHKVKKIEIQRFGEFARMIRGTGLHRNCVYLDKFGAFFDVDPVVLNILAPEGVPFICGLQYVVKITGKTTMATPRPASFYGLTSEKLDFNLCPWPIFRHALWEHTPDYRNTPNYNQVGQKAWTYETAICADPRPGRPTDERLYTLHTGEWVRLWSHKFHSKSKPVELENGALYKVAVVHSWAANERFEARLRPSKEKISEEQRRYFERMTTRVRSNFVKDLRMLKLANKLGC